MSPIEIKKLVVGQMQENCYLVWDRLTRDAIIIDPGDDADFIISAVSSNELSPKALIATHGHFDHTMAVLELKLAFAIPFYMHQKDEFLLKRITQTAKHFTGFDPGPPPKVDIYLKKSTINIGSLVLKVLEIPGHTPGSVALYSKNAKAVFVGDLVFEEGTGRVDFSYSNKSELLKSVAKIHKLPVGTTVYPGHGDEFTI